jgi:SAF domain
VATVLDRSGETAGGRGRSSPTETHLPSPPVVRRPALAAASLALVVVSIAVFVSIYSSASRQIEVLQLVRPVAEGQPLVLADLGQASITSNGALPTIPAAQAGEVTGKVAAVPLASGSLLVASELTSVRPLAPGDAVVGIALKDGQIPADGLQPGDVVMVVQTEAPGTAVAGGQGPTSGSATDANGQSTGVLVSRAGVRSVDQPPATSSEGDTELVSVEVSQTLAPEVAIAATADQVSLVLLPTAAQTS